MGGPGSGSVADDLSNRRFARLHVVRRVPNGAHRKVRWLCKCDCGNETIVGASLLRNGHVKSCGCYYRDTSTTRSLTHGHSAGGKQTGIYRVWAQMIQRCTNESSKNFEDYGGRGIKVCDRWVESFENFLTDVGPRPVTMTLDRIDNNGNYEPGNVRWATPQQQVRNARSNIIVRFRGREMCLAEAAEVAGVNYQSLYTRVVRMGWGIERSVSDLL